ncbi:hypothetical protein [Aliarcobacter butzleri]|uniref:hypothetical protein n=1 Tax=Aliarcobacter butzleri TaxID=28197 RepID=UPI0021B27D6D|nr:hypothetical protein [Aliarcobacter butzleri]MCT7572224.1 hypothetical protein [Aliarcobacter butzleri]
MEYIEYILIFIVLFIFYKIYSSDGSKNMKYIRHKNKTLTTREKILEQKHLFEVEDVYFIKNTMLLTLSEKKNIIIEIYTKEGFTVNNLSDTHIQFKKEKTFSLLWAILWLCLFLVGLLVYIFYYMSKSDDIVTITLDPSKCKNDIKEDAEEKSTIKNSKTKELLELKDMLEKELISKEEFENLKSELLKIKE